MKSIQPKLDLAGIDVIIVEFLKIRLMSLPVRIKNDHRVMVHSRLHARHWRGKTAKFYAVIQSETKKGVLDADL